jgi:hemolysin III
MREEEKINSFTHALGLVLSIIGFELLLRRTFQSGDGWQIAGCAVYASALVAVYAASTLSHSFEQPRLRRLFRILDQAFIFLLIAGTFTPLALTYLRGGAWWVLFGVVWTIALGGFFSKAIFAHRVDTVSAVLHVILGWLPVIAIKPMLAAVPGGLLLSMLYGGVCYTCGVFFLSRDERYPYFHAIWHLLVIAGSAFHFWGIYSYCTAV